MERMNLKKTDSEKGRKGNVCVRAREEQRANLIKKRREKNMIERERERERERKKNSFYVS